MSEKCVHYNDCQPRQKKKLKGCMGRPCIEPESSAPSALLKLIDDYGKACIALGGTSYVLDVGASSKQRLASKLQSKLQDAVRDHTPTPDTPDKRVGDGEFSEREYAIMLEAFMTGRVYASMGEKERPADIQAKLKRNCQNAVEAKPQPKPATAKHEEGGG